MNNDPQIYVPVLEDWYPCFKIRWGNSDILLVRVKLHLSCLKQPDQPFLRVSVWGADDMGMDKDYAPTELDKATEDYLKIIQRKYPTRKWLTEQGFKPF